MGLKNGKGIFFFQKIPIGKTGFLQFYQERMIIF